MSPFFLHHEPFDDVTLDDIRPPFHPLRYPIDGEFDSDTLLTSTYFVEPDPSKPSYPSVIHLSSASFASSAAGQTLPLAHGHGFIRTCAVPPGYRHAWDGGHGEDAPSGFRNGYLPFNG